MVSRRQLLKLSALGTATFAAPLAYSASNTTMTHKNGSPLGSPSLKDVDDNARSLDLLVCGESPTYMDRRGVQRRSWAGMEGEFSAEQIARKKQFDVFLNSSGFEAPMPYEAGIELIRITQTVTYDKKDYRAKSEALPFTTSDWATDVSKLVLIGDDSLRQQLADHSNPNNGVGMLAFPRTSVAAAASSASRVLSALRVNIWEDQFVALITDKPTKDPGTWDWTPAFEAASVYVKNSGGGVIELTEGVFSLTRIYRRNGVSIECRGSAATYLQALPFNPENGPYGLIEQEDGPVVGSHIRGVHLLGLPASNPDQWGMYLHAKWDAAYQHGGLWMSVHDDVRITYFNKGIWSRGGYTVAHYKRPQQFLDFRSVYVQVLTGGEALRMTGQHGQVNFTLGSAEGRDGNIALRAATLSFDPDPSTTADNASCSGESTNDISGKGNAVQAPINMTFGAKFSIQKSQEGIYSQGAKNIIISGIWGENIGKFLTVVNNSHVELEKSHLAKAADGGVLGSPGDGYLFSCQSNSTLVLRNDNDITGLTDSVTDPAMSVNNIAGIDMQLTYFNGDTTGKFKVSGYKSVIIADDGKVVLGGHKFVIVSENKDQTILLKTVNANAAPGEQVMLRANSGPITLSVGGNICLGGMSAVTVPQFGIVVLVRKFEVDSSGEWDLVSVPEHYGVDVPTNGYYASGTRIWRSDAAAEDFIGVMCTASGLAGSTAVFKIFSIS